MHTGGIIITVHRPARALLESFVLAQRRPSSCYDGGSPLPLKHARAI